jgi:hypothetical protein
VKPTGLLISRYIFRPAPFLVRGMSTTSLKSAAASLVEVILKLFLMCQSLWQPDQHLSNVGVHVESVRGLAKEPCEAHVAESPVARARVQITLRYANRLEAWHGAKLSAFKAWVVQYPLAFGRFLVLSRIEAGNCLHAVSVRYTTVSRASIKYHHRAHLIITANAPELDF